MRCQEDGCVEKMVHIVVVGCCPCSLLSETTTGLGGRYPHIDAAGIITEAAQDIRTGIAKAQFAGCLDRMVSYAVVVR